MARWYELADNPKAITELYETVPALERLDLHELLLHRDGPRLTLKANLYPFPEIPPDRWVRNGFNRVIIQLDFWGVQSVSISGWSTEIVIDIEIERINSEEISVLAKPREGDSYFSFVCQDFSIARVAGYMAEQ
ncbi:MAG TPA: Imm50 family immunity protein [Blastocatellia bacterium]|nr:Imm50 family immunity protein [Blastocatellia bacterium]